MQDEPWEHYRRDRTWTGWSYPIGRTPVEAALRKAGVRLLSLNFSQPGRGGDSTVITLLRADRYADIGTTYHLTRGTPRRPRTTLALSAVPSSLRSQAAEALTTGGALDGACAWLARAEKADPTWLDKSHNWTAYLDSGVLRVMESER
ncbi:hypothetical protein ACFPIJ_38905 [Dactylosporangium cerinum]|uniref:Uncharacterized protein n=1 Tax=Dactylosporangium cerinum TaxID=1434730 RepID=A0ABV9W8V4_9ACTN